jgi:hypothetical protein
MQRDCGIVRFSLDSASRGFSFVSSVHRMRQSEIETRTFVNSSTRPRFSLFISPRFIGSWTTQDRHRGYSGSFSRKTSQLECRIVHRARSSPQIVPLSILEIRLNKSLIRPGNQGGPVKIENIPDSVWGSPDEEEWTNRDCLSTLQSVPQYIEAPTEKIAVSVTYHGHTDLFIPSVVLSCYLTLWY